jgi:hypothetical protein
MSASGMMFLCRFISVLCPSVTQCPCHLEPSEDFQTLPREKLKFYETSCQWKMVSFIQRMRILFPGWIPCEAGETFTAVAELRCLPCRSKSTS